MPSTYAPFNQPISWKQRQNILEKITSWNIQGAIAITSPQKNLTASLNWRQETSQYYINLFGPLGVGAIQILGTPKQITLHTSDGKIFSDTSPENLLQAQLGWHLPITNLFYWIRGLPAPHVPAKKTFDVYHHITVMHQQGWTIQYLRYTGIQKTDLPSKITLHNATLHIKIVISRYMIRAS